MDEYTKYIVASNLTAAYFAGIKNKLELPTWDDPTTTAREMDQPFKEVIAVYVDFIGELEERGTLGIVGR